MNTHMYLCDKNEGCHNVQIRSNNRFEFHEPLKGSLQQQELFDLALCWVIIPSSSQKHLFCFPECLRTSCISTSHTFDPSFGRLWVQTEMEKRIYVTDVCVFRKKWWKSKSTILVCVCGRIPWSNADLSLCLKTGGTGSKTFRFLPLGSVPLQPSYFPTTVILLII